MLLLEVVTHQKGGKNGKKYETNIYENDHALMNSANLRLPNNNDILLSGEEIRPFLCYC